ncbi:MAG: hypothetical protein R2845_04840 [Thermomicrobiales bacterium]
MYGARYSLVMGIGAVVLSFIVGVTLGAVAIFYRKLDSVIMRLIDILMAFPGILLAIAIVAALEPACSTSSSPSASTRFRDSRIAFHSCCRCEREFVVPRGRRSSTGIVRRHIFINLVSPITVYASVP